MNKFIRGLITEASPLNFPPDASSDELNFNLDKTGRRTRRRGMDFELGALVNDGGHIYNERNGLKVQTYLWENVGEIGDLSLACVQIGSKVYFHNRESEVLSTAPVGMVDLNLGRSRQMDFTTVDGDLIIATGGRKLWSVEYSDGFQFELKPFTLKVRDMWGVADVLEGRNLNEGTDVSHRPTAISQNHLYNLRNQGWAVPRSIGWPGERGGFMGDPMHEAKIWAGEGEAYGKWPSNADVQHEWIRPDPESDNQQLRFFVPDFVENPPHNVEAPKGYFIIDPLLRGTSRVAEYEKNGDKYEDVDRPYLDLMNPLATDSTAGGASFVEEYAGRIWYAGFKGGNDDGDTESPKLTGYVMYSQLVNTPADLGKCYQEGDPTDPETSDVIDTDGGLVRISGMGRVLSMKAMGTGLMVIATNGLWMVSGGLDDGFTATNMRVDKISEVAPSSSTSVVEVEGTLLFWGVDGIYHVTPSEAGGWQVANITQNTIQSYYDDISLNGKIEVKGFYDRYERQVRWLFSRGQSQGVAEMEELILDMNVGAWFPFKIFNDGMQQEGDRPFVMDYMEARPFTREILEDEVVVDDTLVDGNGNLIVLEEEILVTTENIPTLKFLTFYYEEDELGVISDTAGLKYSFAEYNNREWKDWGEQDAAAYMVTGANTQGDSSRDKMTPYLTFHMEKEKDCEPFDDTRPSVGVCKPYDCESVEEYILSTSPLHYYTFAETDDPFPNLGTIDTQATVSGELSDYDTAAPVPIYGPDFCNDATGLWYRDTASWHTGYDWPEADTEGSFTGACLFAPGTSGSVNEGGIFHFDRAIEYENNGGNQGVTFYLEWRKGSFSATPGWWEIRTRGTLTGSHSPWYPVAPVGSFHSVVCKWTVDFQAGGYTVDALISVDGQTVGDWQSSLGGHPNVQWYPGNTFRGGSYATFSAHMFLTENEVDPVAFDLALRRNYSTYEPPAWCTADDVEEFPECTAEYSCDSIITKGTELGFGMVDYHDFQGAATLPEYLKLADGENSAVQVGPDYLQFVGDAMPAGPFSGYWTIGEEDIDQCAGKIRGLVVPDVDTSPGSFDVTKFQSPDKAMVLAHKGGLDAGWSGVSSVLDFTINYDWFKESTTPVSGSWTVNCAMQYSPTIPSYTGFSYRIGSGNVDGALFNPSYTAGMNMTVASIELGGLSMEAEYLGPQNLPWKNRWYLDIIFTIETNVGSYQETVKYLIFEADVKTAAGSDVTITGTSPTAILDGVGANTYALGTAPSMSQPDMADMLSSLDTNFADYTPPAYCELIPPKDACSAVGSSCLVTTGWDNATSATTSRLSRQFEAYREVRGTDSIGYDVVTTRNRVRGRGNSYWMRMDTKPNHACTILGWNLAVQGNSYV